MWYSLSPGAEETKRQIVKDVTYSYITVTNSLQLGTAKAEEDPSPEMVSELLDEILSKTCNLYLHGHY